MLLFEILTWVVLGTALAVAQLRRVPPPHEDYSAEAGTIAIGTLAAAGSGAVCRLTVGQGIPPGDYSFVALVVAAAGAMLALALSRTVTGRPR